MEDMPIARPRKYPTRNARQAAYQERQNQKKAEATRLAESMRQAVAVATARGLLPLLETDELTQAEKLVEMLKKIGAGDAKTLTS